MATSCSYYAFPPKISCTAESRPPRFGLPKPSTSSSSAAYKVMKPIPYHPQISTIMDLPRTIKEIPGKLLDALVDHVFEFVDQPYLPSQSNFGPVEEIGKAVRATAVHGSIPHDFPEGVYIRNGTNPLHGVPKSAVSIFGKSNSVRFGVPNKNMSNTNVFEHAGKLYAVSENDVAPYEIDIHTLETLGTWDHDIAQSWNRPSTSHPKVSIIL
ncbi:hypothetical protein Sango_2220000 [Sesamum angolense]|uniref:Uncharacterized protein n=1 Tax=Sesamum angolense TaxID=2727404 RepID=A0AAE1W8P5_9LAMI|nr:hypothetical protein Sango_2220000 [Sesamum angolense]